jgi:pentatricopeptide repeat protein
MKKHSILDASTAENVIFALCATKAWKQTLDFLGMIKFSCKPNASTYSVIIATAFYNRDYDTGWKLLREMISNQRIALPEVYMSWFKNCPRNIEDFEKMMYFIGNNNVLIPKNVGVDLAKAFHELGFVG